MIQIPHRLQGPWSNIGYLLIAHILQKPPLREMGYPEMVVFEHNGVMHYTVAEALIYKMEVVDKNSGYSWTTSND
jgi:hypothetical protein